MIWNWIAFYAAQRPRSLAVILTGQGITYAKFATDVARAAEDLKARLPASAALVGVAVQNSYMHWLAILALGRLGLVSASVIDAADVAAARPDCLLTDREGDSHGLPLILASPAWATGGPDPARLAVRDPRHAGPLRLVVSSGTTGEPKRIMLTGEAIDLRMKPLIAAYGINTATRMNVQAGEGTMGGFILPVATWAAGAVVVLAADPMFNDKIPAAAKPDLLVLATGKLDAMLAQTHEDVEAFPGARFIVGGSPVPHSMRERARRRLSRRIGIVYASTEGGNIAIDYGEHDDWVPQAVGVPLPDVDLQIVDDAGEVLAAGVEGQIRYRTLGQADAYFEDPDASREAFRDGWFYPGDFGLMTPDGRLVVGGRSGDTFNISGVKTTPIALEDVALSVDGVEDAGACALRDDRGDLAVVAVRVSAVYRADALVQALGDRFKFRIAITEVEEVPRNRMGKILRPALTQMIIDQRKAMG